MLIAMGRMGIEPIVATCASAVVCCCDDRLRLSLSDDRNAIRIVIALNVIACVPSSAPRS